jgi:bifunctional non-homologous end joining protein LigD
MLAASDRGRLPAGLEWAYEHKLDGYRCCCRVAADGTTVLTSRNGIDFTDEFAAVAAVLGQVAEGRPAVLDGEIVVYNDAGQIDFGLLQERRGRYQTHRGSPIPFDDLPVRLLVFDLLRLGDRSLLGAPYDERRALLAGLAMPDPYRVAVVPAVTFTDLDADHSTPEHLLRRVAEAGHEGLVAKRRHAGYHPGRRSDAWLKHPLTQTTEVIVCGYRPGQGRLTGRMGGLLLGAHDPVTGDLVYIGDVGTGFTEAERSRLQSRLDALERRTHPFAATPPREDTARAHWVEPSLVGEVVYRQFTRGAGRLRHTAWRGLRADRTPAEVVAPAPGRSAGGGRGLPDPIGADAPPPVDTEPLGPKVTVRVGDRRLTLSNLDKTLYPDGTIKSEVINYYTRMAPVLLPHLAGRPVTFVRYPDGVGGQEFFEKNVPAGAPDWLPTARLPRSTAGNPGDTITYPLLEELAGLVWAANMAALELHVPQWRIAPGPARGLPDRLVFDLDPGPGTTIVECCRVGERVRDILVDDGLTPVAKTSGSKGLQVYAGIRTDRPDAPSAYAKRVAQRLARETPDAVTAVMAKARRTGKVFVDWSQNNPAKTTVAPYSLRGRDEPTVSTPVTWAEVRACATPADLVFTAHDVPDRVGDIGDLFADLDTDAAELP